MEVLLLAVAGFAYYQYLEYEKFKSTYSLKIAKVGFDFTRSLNDSFKNLYVNVTVAVNNPSQLTQSLSSLKLTANYNSKVVGSFQNVTAINLKNGENIYVLPIALNTLGLFTSVQQALAAFKAKQPINVNIAGSATIGGYEIPINQTVKVI